jgi:site-specific recombinase XerD
MDITIKTSLNEFYVDQEIKGNSEKTVLNYKRMLSYFSDYLGENTNVNDITIAKLREYQLYLKNKPKNVNHPFKKGISAEIKMSNISLQSYIRHLRAYLKWLYEEGYIENNLTKKFKLPKAKQPVVEILDDMEINKIMKAYNTNCELGVRNLSIIALMIDSGLRRQEVSNLKVEDVHLSQGIIKVHGKGDKERIVPLGLNTKKLILKYLNNFRPLPEDKSNALFVSQLLYQLSYTSTHTGSRNPQIRTVFLPHGIKPVSDL